MSREFQFQSGTGTTATTTNNTDGTQTIKYDATGPSSLTFDPLNLSGSDVATIGFSENIISPGRIKADAQTADNPAVQVSITGGNAFASASTNKLGGGATIGGGNGVGGVNATFALFGGGGVGTGAGEIGMSAPAGIGGSATTGVPWSWITLSLDVSAGGTFTLSSSQYASTCIMLTGSLAADATIVFPNVPGFWILNDQTLTFNGHQVLIKAASSTVVVGGSPTIVFVMTDGAGNIWQK